MNLGDNLTSGNSAGARKQNKGILYGTGTRIQGTKEIVEVEVWTWSRNRGCLRIFCPLCNKDRP